MTNASLLLKPSWICTNDNEGQGTKQRIGSFYPTVLQAGM